MTPPRDAVVKAWNRQAWAARDWDKYQDCPVCTMSGGTPCADRRHVPLGRVRRTTPHKGRPEVVFGILVPSWD